MPSEDYISQNIRELQQSQNAMDSSLNLGGLTGENLPYPNEGSKEPAGLKRTKLSIMDKSGKIGSQSNYKIKLLQTNPLQSIMEEGVAIDESIIGTNSPRRMVAED